MWCLQGVSLRLRTNVLPKAEVANRSGAKGNAKAKKCVTCEGKGWKHVYSQASSFCMRTVESVSKGLL
jgi:DnaJ family protein A protein 2